MNVKSKSALPHFLRVTQSLALVGGLSVPFVMQACGGEVDSPNPGHGGGIGAIDSGYDGYVTGDYAVDGGCCGVNVMDAPYDPDVSTGVAPIDSGYDGGPIGDQAVDSGGD